MSIPLRYAHDKDVKILYGSEYLSKFPEILLYYESQGKRIFIVDDIHGHLVKELVQYVGVTQVGTFTLSLSYLEKPDNIIPRTKYSTNFTIVIYEIFRYNQP